MSKPKTKTDFSCGVIPIRNRKSIREYLLVQHRAGHWAFPKGHPEKKENPIQTAIRELKEETGLVATSLIENPAFEEHYVFTKRSGKVIEKTVTYYIGRIATDAALVLQEEEVANAQWGDATATAALMTFDAGLRLLDEVEAWLLKEDGFITP
ncbi:MAG: NUDIX domain-containing protein [Algisphaera sp.]